MSPWSCSAAQLHPARLDGQRRRAAQVAELAGGAGDDRVDHLLVPLLAALHVLAQPEPLAARALALPAATVELVALVDAVAALRAGVSVPGHVGRDLSLIHISEPTRLGMISYAVFCLK